MQVTDRYQNLAALSGKNLSCLEENLKEIAEQCEDDVRTSTADESSPATNITEYGGSGKFEHGNNTTSESFIKDLLP